MVKQSLIKISKLVSLIVLMAFVSCKQDDKKIENDNSMGTNVFLEEWTGPYGGVPAFDKMKIDELKAAVEKGNGIESGAEIDAYCKQYRSSYF